MKCTIAKILHNELFGGLIIVIIFFLLLLTSCASTNDLTQTMLLRQNSYQAAVPDDSRNVEIIRKMAESKKDHSSSDYKIGPEDLLEIDVFQVPELKTSARVSGRGYIKLLLLDEVKAGGLTVSELESVLADKLRKYLKEPAVGVFVKEFRSQQVSVLGAVKNPQVYYVSGQKYLLDMLSLSGGLTDLAGSVCIIQRGADDTGGGAGEKLVIDLDELLTNGRAELNVPVHSGDIIHVPKKGIFFVTGAVGQSGEFPLQGKMTVTQAIGTAKGLNYEASRSDIKIYRVTGKPQREVLSVDYDSLLSGKTADIEIKDKDIIIVSTNGLKNIIKGLAGTLNFGVFSLGRVYY